MINLDWQKYSTKCVPGQYVPNAPVLLLGWCPGKEENNRGIPFCGDSGTELNSLYLPAAGLQRYSIHVDNVIQYHPWGNKKPSPNDIEIASPDFLERLKRMNPKYIITLGDLPNYLFHPLANKYKIGANRGIPYEWQGKVILPTFHPATGLRSYEKNEYPRTMSFILEDFKYFGRLISGEEPFIPMQPNNIETVHINQNGQITKLLQDAQIIAVDTEFNPETGDLWSLQFSTNAQTGYLVLTADIEFIREFAEIVNSNKIEIIYHNALADLSKLEKIGIQTHKIQDTMQMAYVLGTQLKGLKPLTARLLHIRLQDYENVINSAQQRKVAEHLDRLLEQEIPEIPLEIEYDVTGNGKPKKVTEFKKWWKSLRLKTFGNANQLKIETQKFNNKFLLAFNSDDEFKSAVKQAEVDRNLEIFKLENGGKKIGKKIETAYSKFNKLVIKFAKQRDAKKKYTPEKFQLDVQRVTKKFSPKSTNLIKSWKNYGHCSQLENLFGKPELATLADVDFPKALKYAGSDPACTFGIWKCLTDLIKQEDQKSQLRMRVNYLTGQYEYLNRPGLINALKVDYDSMPLICDVINTGFRIDVDYFHQKSAECKVIIDQAREEIFTTVGHKFNINSNQQLLQVLNKMGIEVETTNAMVLKEIDHPFLKLLSKYKKAIKLDSTYFEPIPRWMKADGRVHSDYSISRASTSRFNSFRPNAQNCYSGDTEILTEKSWIRFDQLTEGIKVMQYQPNDKSLSLVMPERIIKATSNKMLYFHNTATDLFCTPEHRCLFESRESKKLVVTAATSFLKDAKIFHAGYFKTDKPDLFSNKAYLQFLIAFQADGTWSHKSLRFTFKKDRKIQRLREILKGFIYHETTQKNGNKDITVYDKKLMACCQKYLGKQKLFSNWIFDLSQNELQIFIDEINKWDGCFERESMYASNIKQNTDWVQIIATLTGRKAKVREYQGKRNISYQIDQQKKAYSLSSNIEIIEKIYDKPIPVFCVTVPSSFVMVRRNGKTIISGNSPKEEVRTGIIPAPGCSLFAIDYSGQELRIQAHFSQDAEMLETFRQGKNLHKEVAAELFGGKPSEVTDIQKSVAKGVNFGIPYGTSAFGLATTLQGKGIKEIDGRPMDETLAQEYIDKYFRKYPGIKAWIEKVKKEVSEYGYSETYSGHRRMIPEAFSSIWKIKSAAGRYGVNNWIQGTGGDMLKLCCPGLKAFYTQFNQIDKILRPIILVHDEIVWEISDHIVAKNLPVIVWFMENSIKLDLQVKTEVKFSQKNWQDCTETPLAKVIEFYEKLA